ncbi:hypothetical protein ACFLS1_09615 [Verrucomicrobiota bacterium]
MKQWIFVPIALLIGLLIGGWGLKADLRKCRNELKAARNLLEANKRQGSNIDSVTRLFGVEPVKRKTGQKEDTEFTKEDISQTTNQIEVAGPDESKQDDTENADQQSEENRLENQIEKAVDMWNLRKDIARSSFISNVGLNEEQIVNFDVFVEAMNIRLSNSIEQFADLLQKEDSMNTELGLRLVNEVTDAMVITYDEMNRTMPDKWKKHAGKDFDLVDFIDPSVATPLIDVQDKLEESRPSRHPTAGQKSNSSSIQIEVN